MLSITSCWESSRTAKSLNNSYTSSTDCSSFKISLCLSSISRTASFKDSPNMADLHSCSNCSSDIVSFSILSVTELLTSGVISLIVVILLFVSIFWYHLLNSLSHVLFYLNFVFCSWTAESVSQILILGLNGTVLRPSILILFLAIVHQHCDPVLYFCLSLSYV